MNIDSQQAASALSDIDAIVRRVRQSRIYNLASLMLIMWGGLAFASYVGSYLWPRGAGYFWTAIYIVGIAGSFLISRFDQARKGARTSVSGRSSPLCCS
jgi:hypothetical protein